MSKIKEIRDTEANKLPSGFQQVGYKLGFDAAMELQLPVLFGQFISRVCVIITIDKYRIIGWPEFYTTEELYKEFLENIYKNEQDKI